MHETMTQIWLIAGWTILHYIWVGVAITGIAWLGRLLLLRRASSNLRYLYSVTCYVSLTLSPIVVLMAVVQYTSRETTPPRLMEKRAFAENPPGALRRLLTWPERFNPRLKKLPEQLSQS